MRTKRSLVTVALLALLFVCTSCFGPFNASNRLHTWNREIENRWLGEAVYLPIRVFVVYNAAFLADAIIFNSIEFWGGDNPIDPTAPERLKALMDKDDAWAAEAKKG
jgi:Domain of unknown function (DUF3332)